LADWEFLGSAVDVLERSIGEAGAVAVAVGAVLLMLALAVLVTLSFMRVAGLLAGLPVPRRAATAWGVGGLVLVWAVCLATGAQLVAGVPVAAHDLYDQARQVGDGLLDPKRFAAESAADPFRDVPGQDLLKALRGKDVIIAFVESYGRVSVEDPQLSPRIRATLEAGTERLRQKGFGSRSAYLTSPTAGGGSWLAHCTLLSGLWVNNQQRYKQLLASDRLTLSGAFGRAGWRTVGFMPGNTMAWPEGQRFYGFDRIYAADDVGYQGSKFAFDSIPDQYSLSALQRAERVGGDRAPVMATIPLLSSHAPWDPVPRLVDWSDVGDGSGFDNGGAADLSADVFSRDRTRVRTDYRDAIDYTLESLVSYVETYGDDDLVLVFLGDHQPAPIIAGRGAGRDVPITIVAHDPAVLGRVSGWGWNEGLMPGPGAPVWRMDAFRDRFLTAFR